MGIVDRIKKIVETEGISYRSFESTIGKSNGYVKQVLEKKGSSPTVDVVMTIIDNYPKYNLLWLISGEGEMIGSEKEKEKPLQEDARVEDIIAEKVAERLEPAIGEMADRVLEAILKVSFSVDSIKSDHEDIKDIQERTYQLIEKKQ